MSATSQTQTVTRQIALQAAWEMGRYAARRGVDYCPLTDAECRLAWANGHNSTREIAW